MQKKITKGKVCIILSALLCFCYISNVSAKKFNMGYLYGSGNYTSMVAYTRKFTR